MKKKAKKIAYAPTDDEQIMFLIGDDEIKKLAIERKFKAARDKSREKVKAAETIPAAKDLVLKVLLERVVTAEEASYKKLNKEINNKKYSEAYRHLSIKARTRIISEEEKAILHLLEAVIATQIFGIPSAKTKKTSDNEILSEIAKNNFIIAKGLITSNNKPSKMLKIISALLDVIFQDTTQAIENPLKEIMSHIKGVVGDTYNEVCEIQQSFEIKLDEAIKHLNIVSKNASYIRLYRAYELFTGTLTSSNEDPNELCKNEIASSDAVIVNVIAKYFIERYSEEPQ